MEFVVFGVCLTVIVTIVLYAYHTTQEKTAVRLGSVHASALEFQQSALQEIRLIRAQEQTERAQMAAERTNVMGTVNHLISELQRENSRRDERIEALLERIRLDLVQCVGDAAAHAIGHVKGEAVSISKMGHQDGVKGVSLTEDATAQGG